MLIERVKLDLIVVLARMQGIEIGDAVHTEHDRFAVDYELAVLVLQSGLDDDPGIAAAPFGAVAAEEAHAVAVALNDQAIAVIFDFVQPNRRRGDARPSGREAGQERRSHAAEDRRGRRKLRI